MFGAIVERSVAFKRGLGVFFCVKKRAHNRLYNVGY